MIDANFAVLLQSGGQKSFKQNPEVNIKVDGRAQKTKNIVVKGHWGWYKVPVTPGPHTVNITLNGTKQLKNWRGLASLWLVGNQKVKAQTVTVEGKIKLPLFPPVVIPKGTIERQQKLGKYNVSLK
jgi:hypothetical protein